MMLTLWLIFGMLLAITGFYLVLSLFIMMRLFTGYLPVRTNLRRDRSVPDYGNSRRA